MTAQQIAEQIRTRKAAEAKARVAAQSAADDFTARLLAALAWAAGDDAAPGPEVQTVKLDELAKDDRR